jgi:hypothetical protein
MADKQDNSRGGTAAVAGVAAFAGGLIAGLIQGRPGESADEKTRLDYIAKLLEAIGTADEAILKALQTLSLPGVAGLTSILTPWVAQDPISIFDQMVNAVGNFDSDQMVDFRNGKRLVLIAESSLDQNISIQMIGNIDDSKETAVDISGPKALIAGGSIAIAVAWDDWMPYIGCRVLVPVAPTAGRLTIRVVTQN